MAQRQSQPGDPPADTAEVFTIWPGDGLPPDTAQWSQRQQISALASGDRILRNIAIPSLTMFRPSDVPANGVSVIVLPGGAFHFLSIDNEGYDVARWFADRGITAFVLKYRVQPTPVDDADFPAFVQALTPKLPKVEQTTVDPPQSYAAAEQARLWAEADGRQAIRYLRAQASEIGIDAGRIGMIGFSAGGVCVNLAATDDPAVRPAFVAGVYPGWRRPLDVPGVAPPLFIAIGDKDRFVAPISAARLYEAWHKAGASAELHVFADSDHGFGIRRQNAASDGWTDLLAAWLSVKGFL